MLSKSKKTQIKIAKQIPKKNIGLVQTVNKFTRNCLAFILGCQLP